MCPKLFQPELQWQSLNVFLIDASTNEIKLTANDMELGIETKIEGEIAERGIIALDAKIFSEIVRKLTGQ